MVLESDNTNAFAMWSSCLQSCDPWIDTPLRDTAWGDSSKLQCVHLKFCSPTVTQTFSLSERRGEPPQPSHVQFWELVLGDDVAFPNFTSQNTRFIPFVRDAEKKPVATYYLPIAHNKRPLLLKTARRSCARSRTTSYQECQRGMFSMTSNHAHWKTFWMKLLTKLWFVSFSKLSPHSGVYTFPGLLICHVGVKHKSVCCKKIH